MLVDTSGEGGGRWSKNVKLCQIVYYTYLNWKKKELKSRSAPVFVYTFKDNKIITVGRNEEFISEITGITFHAKSILKRQL